MRVPTELDYTDTVIAMARAFGWLTMHQRPARTSKGWRTPVSGNKGFFDFVLIHEKTGAVIFAELKTERGVVSADQRRWIAAAEKSPNRTVVWVVPRDMDEIERTLRGG